MKHKVSLARPHSKVASGLGGWKQPGLGRPLLLRARHASETGSEAWRPLRVESHVSRERRAVGAEMKWKRLSRPSPMRLNRARSPSGASKKCVAMARGGRNVSLHPIP